MTQEKAKFTLINLFELAGFATGTYTLIDWTGAVASGVDIADFQLNAPVGVAGNFNIVGDSLQLNITAIPEPSGWALLSLGAFVFLVSRRRLARA